MDQGLSPPVAVSKLGQFCPFHFAHVSDVTLEAICPFYQVPMPGEVKYPTQEVNVMDAQTVIHTTLIVCRVGTEQTAAKASSSNGAKCTHELYKMSA